MQSVLIVLLIGLVAALGALVTARAFNVRWWQALVTAGGTWVAVITVQILILTYLHSLAH